MFDSQSIELGDGIILRDGKRGFVGDIDHDAFTIRVLIPTNNIKGKDDLSVNIDIITANISDITHVLKLKRGQVDRPDELPVTNLLHDGCTCNIGLDSDGNHVFICVNPDACDKCRVFHNKKVSQYLNIVR